MKSGSSSHPGSDSGQVTNQPKKNAAAIASRMIHTFRVKLSPKSHAMTRPSQRSRAVSTSLKLENVEVQRFRVTYVSTQASVARPSDIVRDPEHSRR